MNQIGISVLVPNRNGIGFLENCFRSIFQQTRFAMEAILLDQGSTDGSVEFTKQKFPSVKIVQMPESSGYAECMSAGMKRGTQEWVVLFNNDAFFSPDWHVAFANGLQKYDDCRVFAVCGFSAGNPSLYYSLGEILVDAIPLRVGFLKPVLTSPVSEMPDEVVCPSGYCGIYHRSVIDRVGLMVDQFDTYFEDIDFGLRAFRCGYRCMLLKDAVVYHVGGVSGHMAKGDSPAIEKQRFKSAFLSGRNSIWFLKRHYSDQLVELILKGHTAEMFRHVKWSLFRKSTASRGKIAGLLNGIVKPCPKDYMDRLPSSREFERELEKISRAWMPWMKERWKFIS